MPWSLVIVCCLACSTTLATVDSRQEWVEAINRDDLQQLRALVDAIEPSNPGDGGRTALMVASKHADHDLMQILLARGAYVNQQSETGGSALMFAVLSHDIDAVSLLLSHRARVSLPSRNGWTALILAAAKNQLSIVDLLLKSGANALHADVYGFNAIMRAIENRHLDVTNRLLLEDSGQLRQRDSLGNSALHYAAGSGDEEIVSLLLASGLVPDKNTRGFWPSDLLPPTADAKLRPQLVSKRQ